jgi:hypothetical protein
MFRPFWTIFRWYNAKFFWSILFDVSDVAVPKKNTIVPSEDDPEGPKYVAVRQ